MAEAAYAKEQSAGMFAVFVTLKILGVLISLYFFLFGLDLMGGSFSALGSKGAGNLFTFSDNPIAGLMVGILATVLVQSSSTSTSIVVGLVGADVLAVKGRTLAPLSQTRLSLGSDSFGRFIEGRWCWRSLTDSC